MSASHFNEQSSVCASWHTFRQVVLQDLIDTYMTIFLVGSQNFTAATVSKEAQQALRVDRLSQ